ncbi:MAG: dTDP-4-dehydrorhamnose 3,5-epimerase [Bacteroidetes bacterium]|nr:dTDP-4-dehydrorhamnose 3,5-epimerase [Bacteroidota bacterium]MDA1121314.1 dTDP-4-dehydrorhamnose 3,5-epimerase [Bacteroidota bacterium]
MKVISTPLKDCYVIEPHVIGDHRGYFYESYNRNKFTQQTGMSMDIVQENQSLSKKGVLRGLHFQLGEMAQAKIVRVLEGEVLDVVVDLRRSSPTFGMSFKEKLSAENKKQVYVPKGFAHGFLILSETAEFFYCIDQVYSPEHEGGLRYDDPSFDIDWGMKNSDIILSSRDENWPAFNPKHKYFD